MTHMRLDTIGNRYRVVTTLCTNSSYSVHQVEDSLTHSTIALKLLPSSSKNNSLLSSLRNEFALLASLNHPHLPQVFELNYDPHVGHYFTMEFASTFTLRSLRGKLTVDVWYEVLLQLLRTLDYLQAKGIVHHDISPDNICILTQKHSDSQAQITRQAHRSDVRAILVDLGIACTPAKSPHPPVGGTIPYIAPEVLRGAPHDHRSDLYSLALTMLDALSSDSAEQSSNTLVRPIGHEQMTLPTFLNASLKPILISMTHPDICARPDSAGALLSVLSDTTHEHDTRHHYQRSWLTMNSLYGRDESLSQIHHCISRTVNTTKPTLPAAPAVLLFSGEAGAGKSRILREVAIHAQLAGVKVLGIRCSPHSSDSFTDTYESICGPTPLSSASASAHYRAQSTPRQELSVCH